MRESGVYTFSQFFVDKVNGIRSNITQALQTSACCVFHVRPHFGPAFGPVTDGDVRRLLSAMPSKSSPLDVLPCSLRKGCADVFKPIITRLANLSFQTGNFLSSYKRTQVLPLLKKAGLNTSSPETTDQSATYRLSPRCLRGSFQHVFVLTCSAPPTSVNSSWLTENGIARRSWTVFTQPLLTSRSLI